MEYEGRGYGECEGWGRGGATGSVSEARLSIGGPRISLPYPLEEVLVVQAQGLDLLLQSPGVLLLVLLLGPLDLLLVLESGLQLLHLYKTHTHRIITNTPDANTTNNNNIP